MRRALLLGLASAAFACSTVRYTVPSAPLAVPKLTFARLKGATVALEVEDARPVLKNSPALVEKVRDTLSKALLDGGLGISGNGTPAITVRFTQYDATFDTPNWRGCTWILLTIGSDTKRIGRCADRPNLKGYATADGAAAVSLEQALGDVLLSIDSGI